MTELSSAKNRAPCPYPDCTSTISASVDDMADGRTVRCGEGHEVKAGGSGLKTLRDAMRKFEGKLASW